MTPPDPGEVQVWAVSTADPPYPLSVLRQLLNAEERLREARYRQPADRRRSVVSRGVLRLLLAEWLGRSPAGVEFATTGQGKPLVVGSDGVEFNASHSGDWVLIALSGAGEVGVDVEQIRPVRDLEAIAAHYFAPAEWRAIRSLPASARTAAFFACWTRKEAFVKAVGTGLETPLDGFEVSVVPGEAPSLVSIGGRAERAATWSLADVAPDAGHAGAVAAARGMRLSFHRWTGAVARAG